jgi:hypothetical protein
MQNRGLAIWIAGMSMVCATQAWAQLRAPASDVVLGNSSAAKAPCPDKTASGAPGLSFDCLNQRLAPKPSAPPSSNVSNPAEGLATASPNRVGLARGF